MTSFELPSALEEWIDKKLKTLGFSLDAPQKLAGPILKISDHFQAPGSRTPWQIPEYQAAYLAYFLPLNFIRSRKVIEEAQTFDFFNSIEEVVDFGCGPGTFSRALLEHGNYSIRHYIGIDTESHLSSYYTDLLQLSEKVEFFTTPLTKAKPQQLLVASYVLNELTNIPPWWFHYDHLVVLEPSTHQNFPRILELRQQLINQGFEILAPCPHHNSCPMQNSKKDWCHDRVHWRQPSWFQKLESHLPIKNHTLTHSYLIATKKSVPKKDFFRIVGDARKEKGKTRWMLCRQSEREFLSVLKKQGPAPELLRGDKIQLKDFVKKSDELRIEIKDLKKL